MKFPFKSRFLIFTISLVLFAATRFFIMLITDFYANRDIFISGGTGFLGKALIEKLLRDCPNINTLYILLRPKKSVTAEDRLEELKNSKAFDRVRKECPHALRKLHAIGGDSGELRLGISDKDLELIQNVSIIFHMAANVKFDDPLRSSILLNTRGTFELVKIAEKLKNLIAFLHCSTAFCNPFKDVVEERVYKMSADWRKTINMAEKLDEYTVNALYKKYTGHFPNSYTFTKNLSEQIIQEYSSKLPMILFRPSVVANALREPVPGWIDNMNGPIAGMVGIAVGVLPTFHCAPHFKLDSVSIDMVTKLTIVATYKRGMEKLKNETIPKNMEVVNCAAGGMFNINMDQCVHLFLLGVAKNPFENCVWNYDRPVISGSYSYFLLCLFIINIPAAILVDSLLFVMGKSPMLLKINRKIIYTVQALMFFDTKEYQIKNQNMNNLENFIPDSEIKTFGVLNEARTIDYFQYFDDVVRGCKYFIFDQPLEASDSAKLRFKIVSALNKAIKFIILILIARYFWLKLAY